MNISHEVLTRDEAYQLAKKDGQKNCANNALVQKYANSNSLTYYVAINTWYYIVDDCDRWAAQALLSEIRRDGLLRTIKFCADDADLLVKGCEPASDIGRLLYRVSRNKCRDYFALNPERNHKRDHLATALQLLRYLKRFSPSNNDWIKEASLQDFLQTENNVKLNQRSEYPRWLIDEMKDIISDVLDWSEVRSEIDRLDLRKFSVPSGTTAEGYKTFGSKLVAIARQVPEAFTAPMGLPYVYPDYDPTTDKGYSKVQAVPKSYKASRIIAMEPVWRQAYSGAVADIIKRKLPYYIDITDQTRNQELACRGSRYNDLATLDASHASDLISKTLFRMVFPPDIVEVIDPLFSTHTLCKGKLRPMQMMSTAGHSLTFIFETIVYYAIAESACRILERLGCNYAYQVSVYGDDVVITSQAAQTAIEFYSMLGLKINEDKSFITGPYRESCGEEYYDGINTTSTYYPRFPVVGVCTGNTISFGKTLYRDTYRGKIDDSTTMLVDLQKRLYGVSNNASLFLWEVLTSVYPKLTTSVYGSICNDLWGAVNVAPAYNPADGKPELSRSVISACQTQRHSYVSLRYVLPKGFNLSEHDKRVFELYKYQHFLQYGPSYATPLDELLGVSDPPMSLEAAFGEGQLIWRYDAL